MAAEREARGHSGLVTLKKKYIYILNGSFYVAMEADEDAVVFKLGSPTQLHFILLSPANP